MLWTPPVTLLRWRVQRGACVLPLSRVLDGQQGRAPWTGVLLDKQFSSSTARSSDAKSADGGRDSPPSAPSTSKRLSPPASSPADKKRRPIKDIRKRILSSLTPHENIYTVPNLLTFSRLLAAPVIGYLVLHDQHVWAVGLFAYAGISDLVDGYIARHWRLQTVVGTVIDPMADKTLMTILTVCLAIKGALPVWLATIILGRDVCFGIAAIYYRWVSLPPPKTMTRYWDFSIPSAEVHPTTISKVNTALQLSLIGICTAQPLLTPDISSFVETLQYIVAGTTLWSGASYIYTKDAVRILTPASARHGGAKRSPHTSKEEEASRAIGKRKRDPEE